MSCASNSRTGLQTTTVLQNQHKQPVERDQRIIRTSSLLCYDCRTMSLYTLSCKCLINAPTLVTRISYKIKNFCHAFVWSWFSTLQGYYSGLPSTYTLEQTKYVHTPRHNLEPSTLTVSQGLPLRVESLTLMPIFKVADYNHLVLSDGAELLKYTHVRTHTRLSISTA